MKRQIRCALVALGSLVGLAFAGSALGAYTPRLEITPGNFETGGTGTTTLRVSQAPTDEPTARITIYAPLGYTATLNQAIGTTLGQARGRLIVGALGGAIQDVTGNVVVADPAQHVQSATLCTGTATHTAVWTFNLTLATGQALQPVPVFVDAITAGPEASFATYRIQTCLPSPDVPEAQGGATLGAKLVEIQFGVGVFTNPPSQGAYPWAGIFTPYTPGTATVNAAGTVESRAEVRQRLLLVLNQPTFNTTTRNVTLAGSLTENGQPIGGISVQILAGTSATALARVTTARTDANGQYRVTLRAAPNVRTMFFRTRAGSPPRDNPAGCTVTAPTIPGVRCVTATAQGFDVMNRAVVSFQVAPGTPTRPGGGCENGTARRDVFRGTARNDCFRGLGGNDRLIGGSGNDRLLGGAGKDLLTGDVGNDRLDGGADGDLMTGGIGRDSLIGGPGDDQFDGGVGDDALAGGPGVDRFNGGFGNDRIASSDGRNETVNCGPGRDTVRADRGDRLIGCERVTRVGT